MNDKIKEILDAWRNKKYILAYTFNYDSAREQNDKLLDYITNLQQDMKNYVDIVLYQRKTIDNLQQENERLKAKIDKANEYINKHPVNACHNLLNILQNGSDKE